MKEEGPDQFRIFLYMLDYSVHLHGNPHELVELPDDAWALRITPYGTHHITTWAQIVKHICETKGVQVSKLSILHSAGRVSPQVND